MTQISIYVKVWKMRILLTVSLFFLPLFYSQAQESPLEQQARTYRDEGYRLQLRGDLDGALSFYQKASQMDPNFAQAFNDAGVILESKGQDERAIEMYEKAIKIDPTCLAAYTNLAFIYERKGDVSKATFYWKKRYRLGEKGEYWWLVSQQHLLSLGTYPEVKKEILEFNAATLSREISYKREQEKLENIEEAKFHFEIGKRAFAEKDYEVAVKELRTVLFLNPTDDKLKTKARDLYVQSERFYLKNQALSHTQSALDYIKSSDYSAAGERLKEALTAVSGITQ